MGLKPMIFMKLKIPPSVEFTDLKCCRSISRSVQSSLIVARICVSRYSSNRHCLIYLSATERNTVTFRGNSRQVGSCASATIAANKPINRVESFGNCELHASWTYDKGTYAARDTVNGTIIVLNMIVRNQNGSLPMGEAQVGLNQPSRAKRGTSITRQ